MPVQSTLAGAVSALAFIGQASAFWRMECHSPIGYARLDPLVEPGEIADHAHTIHGGQSFNMNTDFAGLMSSTCTSCRVKEDNSVYWTPSLHFVHPNGTTELVPQIGGMLAYYLLYGEDIQAFPKDFRLLAGDKSQRNFTYEVPDPPKPWSGQDATQKALAQKAVGFNCLNYPKNQPEATLGRHFMPDKAYLDANCVSGLRLELMFPSCWNGKDTDSKDHKSHMAYPSMTIDGDCPSGFETRLPSLLYETIWNTYAFAGVDGQFVLANGDPTGYGYHGDFMTGWDVDFLQDAVDTCTNLSGKIDDCPIFTLQSEAEAALCKMDIPDVLADDNIEGPREGLPGNVPIQSGPAYASPLQAGGAPTPPAYTAPISATPLVPTLSVGQGTRPATDSNGGGITVLDIDLDNKAVETPAPIPTQAAVLAEGVDDEEVNDKIVATSTFTSAGAVYEVVWEQVDVTVTESAPEETAAAKHRRHQHHARQNHHNLI